MTLASLARRAKLALLALFLLPVAVAAAATGPVDTAQTASSAGWDLVVQYGPIWGAALLAFGLASSFLRRNAAAHWIAQGRALAAVTGASMTLGAVLDWHFAGAPIAGVLVTAIMAIKLVWSPTVVATIAVTEATAEPPLQPPTPRAFQIGPTLLAVLLVGAVLQPACATASPHAAAGVKAALDCEQPNLVAVALDGLALATQAILSTISGDGHPDASALKAALGGIKSDGLRCAATGAIAAILTPVPTRPDEPSAAGLEVDAAELRAAFAAVRSEWGLSSVRVAGTVL